MADVWMVPMAEYDRLVKARADLDTLIKGLRPTPREWCNTHGGIAPNDHHTEESCPDRAPLFVASPAALVVLQAHKEMTQ